MPQGYRNRIKGSGCFRQPLRSPSTPSQGERGKPPAVHPIDITQNPSPQAPPTILPPSSPTLCLLRIYPPTSHYSKSVSGWARKCSCLSSRKGTLPTAERSVSHPRLGDVWSPVAPHSCEAVADGLIARGLSQSLPRLSLSKAVILQGGHMRGARDSALKGKVIVTWT